jgi:hypothetical protein
VTETALTGSLFLAYTASGLALFAIVVGVALLLAGIGFAIIALAVFRNKESGTKGPPVAPSAEAGAV